MDNNKLVLDTIERLKSKGMSDEEAISAYENAWEKYEASNTPKEKYATASKYGIPRETIKKQTIQSHLQSGTPLNLSELDALKQAKAQKINAIKDIGSKVGRFGLAPIATALSAKDVYENIEKGDYTDAAIDATGAASGLATIAGSTMAAPLAIPVVGREIGRLGGKYMWSQVPESTKKGAISSLSQSLEKTQEDTPEAEERRRILKEKFGVNVTPYKDKPAPQKSLTREEKQATEAELDKLSNPEMVKKEEELKAYEDALATSRVTNPRLTEGQHEMNALRAVRQLREKKELELKGKTPLTAAGDFLSGLFEESPEQAKQRREMARKEFDRANEVRVSMGLPKRPMPKEYEEIGVPAQQDEKPYEFTSKQYAATPPKSSGLADQKTPSFDEFLKQYANYDYKNELEGVSDEELAGLTKGRGEKRNISYIAETPEGFKAPDVNEVKQEAISVAKRLGQNPATFLGQIDQESSFNPLAISKTGAKGLGQMFPAAYSDAQKMDKEGILKNIPYREMIKPENWKLQLYAAGLYNQWIDTYMTKGAGDEARLKWYSGGADEEKAKARGTDPTAYANSVLKRAKKYEKELAGQAPSEAPTAETPPKLVSRSPAMVSEEEEGEEIIPRITDKSSIDKVAKLKSIQNFLTGKEGEAPLSFGPYSDTEAGRGLYASGMSDQNRLLNLKQRYDEMMAAKNIPSDTKFTPVEGPDGTAPPALMGTEAPSMPSSEQPSVPSAVQSDKTSSAQKEIDRAIELQKSKSSLQKDLLAAQQEAATNKFYANLARAATQIATGASGLKGSVAAKMPDTGVFEDLQKQADVPVAELEQRIKIQGDDPNSEVSNSMRSILEKDLKDIGVSANLSGLSYNQMKEIYSPISSRISRVEAAREKKETKADTEKTKEEEKLGKFIERARDDINAKEIGKTAERMKKLDHGISLFEGKGRTGAQDLAAFFTMMKGIQQDDSVIREAEQKLGMQLGSLSSRLKAKFAKFFRGELFDEKQRQEMLQLMKIQRDQIKNDLGDSLSTFYEDLKNQPMMKGKSEEEVNEVWKRITPYNFNFPEIEKNKYIKKIAEENFNGNIKQATKYLKEKGYIE